MSRYYEMMVTVSDFATDRQAAVEAAANREWDFTDCSEGDGIIVLTGQESLCGGESEAEFAERITKAIWQANGEFCEVEVRVTDLENIPCETYQLDEDGYERLQRVDSPAPEPSDDGGP
ncbi:MAG: hypothetical protein MI757_00170 [Pirellulales bacterium]|nr:hypothetical protein [Pirellulales bacterium]